jgi:5-methylcytosine-specific restriction endonuclease McrA
MNFEKFKTWLGNQGAEVLLPTNQYELVRFKTVNGVSVVYTGKRGTTFTGESQQAYDLFKQHKGWKVVNRKRRALTQQKARLASRDGKMCFFCEVKPEKLDDLTVEHILSFSHGGTDNINNLALACGDCQVKLGRLSITAKIKYRDKTLAPKRGRAVIEWYKHAKDELPPDNDIKFAQEYPSDVSA